MAAGAVDAWITPIQMKKNRPGVIFSLLCKEQDLKGMRKLLFTETSALGIREQMVSRTVLEREESTIEVAGHSVRIKGAVYEGETVNLAPEYEDLRQLSVSTGIPLKQLYSMCAGKTAQRKL
jgi:hypothetical protein